MTPPPIVIRLGARPLEAAWERTEAWLGDRFRPRNFGVRTIDLPTRAIVVGVGGTCLGGAGRTPLAIGIAREVAARGVAVAFVGHGFGARGLGEARRAKIDDGVDDVGDEALIAARSLAGIAPVFVARRRRDAIASAASAATVVVVDRLLQTRPRRLALSVLAIAEGAHAARSRGIAAADVVVTVGGDGCPGQVSLATLGSPSRTVSADEARGLRVGLVTSVARPERVRRSAVSLGLDVRVHVERADHARVGPRLAGELAAIGARNQVDRWLFDAKSAALFEARSEAAWRLVHAVTPPRELIDRVCALAAISRDDDLPAKFARP